jgi:hypothetical protein
MLVRVTVLVLALVAFAAPPAVVLVAAVTLNEFPANTVSPALLTTFTALKFCLIAANLLSVERTELLPVVLRSI